MASVCGPDSSKAWSPRRGEVGDAEPGSADQVRVLMEPGVPGSAVCWDDVHGEDLLRVAAVGACCVALVAVRGAGAGIAADGGGDVLLGDQGASCGHSYARRRTARRAGRRRRLLAALGSVAVWEPAASGWVTGALVLVWVGGVLLPHATKSRLPARPQTVAATAAECVCVMTSLPVRSDRPRSSDPSLDGRVHVIAGPRQPRCRGAREIGGALRGHGKSCRRDP